MTADLRYPIGPFRPPEAATPASRAVRIGEIARLPADLRAEVEARSEARLDTPYRPGGWTVRQVVHHLPDSHLNAYLRFKLALTEDAPVVRPYDEGGWAELPDSAGPVGASLDLLDALHRRWTALMEGMDKRAWGRTFVHPEHGRAFTLDEALEMYAWHGRHHLAHLRGAP